MNIQTEVIIFKVNHYNMGDNKGLSVRVLGDHVSNNNSFGKDISEATIQNYGELQYLNQIPAESFPAKFKANLSLGTVKDRTGKEKTGVFLSNLQYVNSMKLVDITK